MTAPEFWFYHLESQPLHAVLPVLVEKTLSRGWRAVLRFSTPERLENIDSALWTYREESFLPHGTARDGHAESQPVFLTLDGANPNGAHALFLLEAATESEPAAIRAHHPAVRRRGRGGQGARPPGMEGREGGGLRGQLLAAGRERRLEEIRVRLAAAPP